MGVRTRLGALLIAGTALALGAGAAGAGADPADPSIAGVIAAPLGVARLAAGDARFAAGAARLAAAATAAGSLGVPQHLDAATTLALVGAADAGFVVAQGGLRGGGHILEGPRGAVLAEHGDLPEADSAGVSGSTFGWSEPKPGSSTTWLVHDEDLITGARTVYQSLGQPLAWTPDGWISLAKGKLLRHLAADGSTSTLISGIPSATARTGYLTVEVKADTAGAVVNYPVKVKGKLRQRLGLVTFAKPGIDVLATTPSGADTIFVGPMALSRHRVVWVMPKTNAGKETTGYVESRARSGGPVTEAASSSSASAICDLVATDDRTALTSSFEGSSGEVMIRVSMLTGTTWQPVTFPGAADDPRFLLYGGLATLGAEIFAGVGGSTADVAGIYTIGTDGTPSRVSTVGQEASPVIDAGLSAGRLTYSDLPSALAAFGGTVRLWQRPVTTTSTPSPALTLGDDVAEPVTPGLPDDDDTTLWAASAGRTAAANWDYTGGSGGLLQLLDRGVITRDIRFTRPPAEAVRLSGPYLLLGELAVYRADGKRLVDFTATPKVHRDHLDLFGSSVVDSTDKGTVETFNAESVRSVNKPLVLARKGICSKKTKMKPATCAGQVAIWGDTIAWSRLDGTIAVRTASPTLHATRDTLKVVRPNGRFTALRLSENVLSWRATTGRADAWALDLQTPGAVPVDLGGYASISVDDHLMAGVHDDGRLSVSELPFGESSPYPPRPLGILAPPSFTPNGDGKADTWAPQVDVSKPVAGVQLMITRDSMPVRTLTGSGPDGSVRDLVWDGTDDTGLPVAAGNYHWQLTADATDGDGELLGAGGGSAVTGTVIVRR